MTGTPGPAGRTRLGRLAVAVAVMVPLLAVSSPRAATPVAAPVRAAADADDIGRIAYAGTEHRSMGRVTGTPATSEPLLGPGPAHFDTEASARGDQVVFTSLRDGVRPQVYLRDAAGGIRKLTSDRDAANPELTPDGRFVVFDSAEPGLGSTQRDLWIVGTDGTGARPLTETPVNETAPTVSPDGARIAYASDIDPLRGRQIYARQLDGGAAVRISDGPAGNADEPAWNPVDDTVNRDLVAYTHTAAPGGEPSGPRLRVTAGLGADGPLLSGEQAGWSTRSAAWQPDGDTILFLSPNGPCGCTNPYDSVYRAVAHSTNTAEVVLYEDRAVDSPTWLGPQNGGSVVVTRITPQARNHATLQDVRPDGSDPRDLGIKVLWEDPAALTNTDPAADPLFNPAKGYDPWTERQNYTPDGRRIVVTRFQGDPEAGRIEQIWLADADGSNEALMPLAGRGPRDWDTDPTFSPDGKLLAFTRTSPGGVGSASGPGRILIADATTGALVDEVRPPAGRTGGDAQPTWSSDGTTLAFTRNHVIDGVGGNKHIWTVPVKALDQQRDLSVEMCPGSCQVIDDSPAFSPDGKRLAFNRKDGGGRVNERNGVMLTDLSDGGCRIVLPTGRSGDPDGCRRDVPDASATGPFQPRDVAWSPDASRLVFSSRRDRPANSPESLSTVELATGTVTPLTTALPGRQKEPAYQQSVNLTVTAPPTADPITEGETGEVTVTVTNQGPSAAPGTTFTAAVPPGVRLDGLTPSAGRCEPGSPQCDLGVLAPGESVTVTARLTGVTPGDQVVDWSVAGAVIDRSPADNATRTLVPVEDAPEPPTPTPTPTPTTPTPPPTTPTPRPTPPPPPTPAPEAGPGLTIDAQPEPGYVGGKVVVTYTVRNGREALATGLTLRLGLPRGIPAGKAPAGCTAGVCALGDLAPGASTVVTIVLSPNKALTTQVTGRITTSGTDADPQDNTARRPIRILQPEIIAVPAIGKPGFVTSVRGKDFPPGTPVTLSWKPGITAAAVPTLPRADGTFIAQLLILAKDQTGPRTITAKGAGFSPVTTPFLVVTGNVAPPDEVARR
ncbi:hypothetical protein ACFV9D_02760 [Streptomyces sp. NPDC059875]|uniref:hypothetical protein n=1 Tax=unclassified Streptomyces TaxID=2593676 RepID=UPI0036461E74